MNKVVALVLSLGLACVPSFGEEILMEQPSLYSTVIVKKTGRVVCLLFSVRRDQRNQSCINTADPKEMVFSYTKMSMAALLFSPEPRSVLVVGLGGGTVPKALNELYPEAEIDAIEIDPLVVEVARDYFDFVPNEQMRVHTTDARIWIRRAALQKKQYDIILLDAFNGEYIPEHLMTREFYEDVNRLLSPGGTMVSNTFAISALYDHESATYASVFGNFINFRLSESANRMIMAPRAEVTDELLKSRAEALRDVLKPYGVPIRRYARLLSRQRDQQPDWDTTARILTDQFSPANLLQGK